MGGPEEGAQNWHESFRTWRKKRLREIEREYGDRLDEVAGFLKEFASKVEARGPRGYLESMTHREGGARLPNEEREPLEAMSLEELRDELPKPKEA